MLWSQAAVETRATPLGFAHVEAALEGQVFKTNRKDKHGIPHSHRTTPHKIAHHSTLRIEQTIVITFCFPCGRSAVTAPRLLFENVSSNGAKVLPSEVNISSTEDNRQGIADRAYKKLDRATGACA